MLKCSKMIKCSTKFKCSTMLYNLQCSKSLKNKKIIGILSSTFLALVHSELNNVSDVLPDKPQEASSGCDADGNWLEVMAHVKFDNIDLPSGPFQSAGKISFQGTVRISYNQCL